MTPLLDFENVSMSYHSSKQETPAVLNLTFSVKKGEFLAIVGPSGCGKSTILNLICGLLSPESGQILIEGKDAHTSNMNIGYMLQKDHLFEWRTIYRNVMLGPEIAKQVTSEKKKYARSLLSSYGLSEFADSKPSQLSGGMRQRAALIRTLVMEPTLLLLDEPFSALDYQTRLNVSDDIGKIIHKESKTAILVTHDISEAISMADRVIILTPRPATVNNIIDINLTVDPRTPLSSRSAPEFKYYFNQIWKELNQS